MLFYKPYQSRRPRIGFVPVFGSGYCAMSPRSGCSATWQAALIISGGPMATILFGGVSAIAAAVVPSSPRHPTPVYLALYELAVVSAAIIVADVARLRSPGALGDFRWLWWLGANAETRGAAMATRHLGDLLMLGIRPRDLPDDLVLRVQDCRAPAALASVVSMYQYYQALDRGRPGEAMANLDLLAVRIRDRRALRSTEFAIEVAFHRARYDLNSERATAILSKVKPGRFTRSSLLRARAAAALAVADWDTATALVSRAGRWLVRRPDYGMVAAEQIWLDEILALAELGRCSEPSSEARLQRLSADALPVPVQPIMPFPATKSPPAGAIQQAFDRFTLRTRIVLVLASREAARLNQNYIGTEHLLLALTEIPECIACRALTSLGVGLDRIQDAIESVIDPAATAASGTPTLTPAVKRVLESAVAEARSRADEHVGTEHLLLGLLHETDGIAGVVLESLSVRCVNVREALRQAIAAPPALDPA